MVLDERNLILNEGAKKLPMAILRLNYACELRYGVLVDLARKVWTGQPVDLAMGSFNVIWQADANAMALASLAQASSPAFILNVSGPEQLSVRRVCTQLGKRMDREVNFVGHESQDALLNNGQMGHRLYGYPRVGAEEMMEMIAQWVMAGAELLQLFWQHQRNKDHRNQGEHAAKANQTQAGLGGHGGSAFSRGRD